MELVTTKKVEDDIIGKLWHYGHFNNPAHPTGVTEGDLPRLKLSDRVVRTAISSYQEFLAVDLDRYTFAYHQRAAIADGDIGPATIKLFNQPRCYCKDYSTEYATGSGSWDSGCWPEYPDNHAFKVKFDKRGMPPFLGDKNDPNSLMEQAWRQTVIGYAYIGIAFFRGDNDARYNTLATWTRGRGWIGLAIVPNDPGCYDEIWAKYDDRYQPRNLLNQWTLLLMHEFGHNMGLPHTRGGVMNPSIVSSPWSQDIWVNDPSYPRLKQWFGGKPIDIGNGPDDPTPPPDNKGQLWFKDSVEANLDDKPLGRYILVPAPEV